MKIGAYILSYRETPWLKANLDWIYDRFDEIAVSIGPAEMNPIQVPDTQSIEMLSKYPDPKNKIKYYHQTKWKNKNEMATAAFEMLNCDYLFQVDGDEFWPLSTFQEALGLLKAGHGVISCPHYIFFKNQKHILSSDRGGDTYFNPARAFNVQKATNIRHIPPLVIPNHGLSHAGCHGHIWHFGWIGRQRIIDKLNYHKGAIMGMTPEYFLDWSPERREWVWNHELGPLRIKKYPKNDIPDSIKNFVQQQI